MRYFILMIFILLTSSAFSQKPSSIYIELRGNVDALGNINLDNITNSKNLSKVDSLIDYQKLKAIVNLREPMKVVNKLSENGWSLVSVTQISSDKENRPNSPFMLYYFKKDFEF